MHFLNNSKTNYKNIIINFLLILIPASYIAGNLILNLNIIILLIYVCSVFRGNFTLNLSHFDKLIIIFFTYIIINGVYNNFYNFDFPNAPSRNLVLIKSLLYFRFLILYFVVKYLIEKNLINFKFLLASFSIFALFVSIDIIIQFHFGRDLFNFVADEASGGRRLAGPFGDEYIAGSFIQRFSIFTLFFIFYFFYQKKVFFYTTTFLIIFINAIGIILAGNRMPFLLFILSIFLVLIFQKEFRKILMPFLLIFTIFFSYLFYSNNNFQYHYYSLANKSAKIIFYLKDKVSGQEIDSNKSYIKGTNTYVKEFETGFFTWQSNKYFGGGIKSFYFNCNNINPDSVKYIGGVNCNSHPHNYYLELLTELGLIGFLLFSIIIFYIFTVSFKQIFLENYSKTKMLIIPFVILFIVEIFPLKTTGSFFTTTNSTFLFLIIAFIAGISEYGSIIKHEKKF